MADEKENKSNLKGYQKRKIFTLSYERQNKI